MKNKRLICFILAVVFVVANVPINIFAENTQSTNYTDNGKAQVGKVETNGDYNKEKDNYNSISDDDNALSKNKEIEKLNYIEKYSNSIAIDNENFDNGSGILSIEDESISPVAVYICDDSTSGSAVSAAKNAPEADFVVRNKWNGGFTGEITLTNLTDSVIENWQIQMEFPHEITSIWNGFVVSKKENIYIIKNPGGNNNINIPVGGNVTFGFIATCEDEIDAPKNVKFIQTTQVAEEKAYTIDYKLINSWNDGFNAQISIKNNTDENIEGWHLEFDYNAVIDNIWNGVIEESFGNHYAISNAEYNSVILPGDTIIVGFTGHLLDGEPENFVLKCSDCGEINTDYEKEGYLVDTDNDGLSDTFEMNIGTNINNVDTDCDGISDYYEVVYGLTSPLAFDSDENGIPDGNEDFDTDGLTFLEEISYGTNHLEADSDKDSISDYAEVKEYTTNPLKFDTDDDGLNDNDELILGFDPGLYDTDGNGICDGEEKIYQSRSFDVVCEDSPELVGVDVEIHMCGNIEDNLQVTNVFGVDTYTSELVGLVGAPIDITCHTSFDTATITYRYDKKLINDETASKLGVLAFDEKTGTYENKNAVVDVEKGTVTFTTNHFCSMPLCNIEEYTTAINNIPDYASEHKFANNNWQGKTITFPEAAYILGISQSSLTAHARNKDLFILKAIGVYNLNDGKTLEIPHVYLSDTAMGEVYLKTFNDGETTCQLMPSDCKTAVYTWSISSDYNFPYDYKGNKNTQPRYGDINKADYGYLKNEERYFISSDAIDKTDTDKDGLYDVFEYLGMRLTNGGLFYTRPDDCDMDSDGLQDGAEIRYLSENGLFAMVSNPLVADSDNDGVNDNEDKHPLMSGKQPDVFLNSAIAFPQAEAFNEGKSYYFTAYAQNNSSDRLTNYSFELRLYYGDEENPDASEFNITNPKEHGIIVCEYSGTPSKHLVPNQYVENTWKIIVDPSMDLEKLKCMAVFKADGYEEIYSLTSLNDFIAAEPDYDRVLDVYVSDSYLAPEIRGDRAFNIHVSVKNNKYSSVKNTKATIVFENPEAIEMLDDFYTTDLTKSVECLKSKESYTFNWEIRVKDGFDLSDVRYTIRVLADDVKSSEATKTIDAESYKTISVSETIGAYVTEKSRSVSITVGCYDAKTVYVVVKNSDGNVMTEESFVQSDNIYSYRFETLLMHGNTYTVTVVVNKGTSDERTLTENVYVYNTYIPKAEKSDITEEEETIEAYLKSAVEQGLLGNYYEGDFLAGGIGVSVAVGFIPIVGQAADIRDLSADVINWEWSAKHMGYTVIDVAALIPGLDTLKGLKYADEAFMIVKRGDKEILIAAEKASEQLLKNDEVIGYAAKHGDEIITAVGKQTDEIADIVKGKVAFGFKSAINDVLVKHNLSFDEFNSLRLQDVSTLTDAEKSTLKAIRENVPTPNSDTLLQKVIPRGDIEKYMDGTYIKIGGYITRADDVAHLSTYDDFYNGLRLDYPGSVYNPTIDDSIGIIRCTTEETSKISIPYGLEMGGSVSESAPFTGNGFTKAANDFIPEFKCDGYLGIEDGSQLIEISKDGKETLKAIYSKIDKRFIPIK